MRFPYPSGKRLEEVLKRAKEYARQTGQPQEFTYGSSCIVVTKDSYLPAIWCHVMNGIIAVPSCEYNPGDGRALAALQQVQVYPEIWEGWSPAGQAFARQACAELSRV